MAEPPLERQTLIALRARREAYRVASGLLNPPLDPYRFYCRHCGHALDGDRLDCNDAIRCNACARRTRLPPGAAAMLREAVRRARPRPCAAGNPLAYVALWAYALVALIVALWAL